jgi:UDP-N-acetylglucosamine:LPS N-acetylglucosamine transferase
MRVIIASGGTGGHISPALAFREELKRRNIPNELLLGGLKVSFPAGDYFEFSAGELNFKGFPKIIKGFFQTFDPVSRSDVVVGFGGYPQFPPILNALINNKKIYLFEPDARPGKSNIFLSPFAHKVFCAFRGASKRFENGVFVGIPVRKLPIISKGEALKILNIHTSLPIVGIIGGSQGSAFLNDLARFLVDRGEFFVLAVVGKRGENEEGKNYKFVKFLENVSLFYCSVDVVISRAGMSSIGEIAYFRKPSLLIPYPYAGGHQVFNALDLYNFGGAEVLLENEARVDIVLENLRKIFLHSEKYRKKLEEYFVPDAEKIMADYILNS